MIALISYHKEPNYGTALQAYALAHAIYRMGKECEYLNYVRMNRKPSLLFLLRRLKQSLASHKGEFAFFKTKPFELITKRFKEFHQKFIPTSDTTYYIDTLSLSATKYERFIVGSDQTWSPFMNQSPYTLNFLEFCPHGTKKASYAPSIGTLTPKSQYINRMRKALTDFDYLSCREKLNCAALSEALQRNVEYVVDPTLLLSEKEWMNVASDANTPHEPYILAYILGTKQCISDFAERLGKKHSLPVFFVVTRPEHFHHDNVIADAGPAEFISLIRNARYVVTDSFHGTIFSINFNVNFYSFAKRTSDTNVEVSNDNDRIPTLLNEYGLAERFRKDSETHFSADIDFTDANRVINKNRQASSEYLKTIINY